MYRTENDGSHPIVLQETKNKKHRPISLLFRSVLPFLELQELQMMACVSTITSLHSKAEILNRKWQQLHHPYPNEEIHGHTNVQYRSLVIDQETGIACDIRERGKIMDFHLQTRRSAFCIAKIVDLKTGKWREHEFKGQIEASAVAYPFLAYLEKEKIMVYDFQSQQLLAGFISSPGICVKHLMINRNGMISILSESQLHVSSFLQECHLFEVQEYDPNGTMLLHDERLLFTEKNYAIGVFDIGRNSLCFLGEVFFPLGEKMTSLVAEGNLLVSLSQKHIFFSSLTCFEMVKSILRPEFCLQLQLVSGQSLYLHTNRNSIAICDFNGANLCELTHLYANPNENYLPEMHLVALYGNALYITQTGGGILSDATSSIMKYVP